MYPCKLFYFFQYCVITARKRSLGQGYIFTGVCHSVNRGGLPQCMLGYPPPSRHPPPPRRPPSSKETALEGDPPSSKETPSRETPSKETPSKETALLQGDPPPGPHPRGKLRGIRSRPTPKGEIEGDQIQAHTQGGNWGGAHTQGGNWGGSDPDPPSPNDDYCCGRYASYWNAFLSEVIFAQNKIQTGPKYTIPKKAQFWGNLCILPQIFTWYSLNLFQVVNVGLDLPGYKGK